MRQAEMVALGGSTAWLEFAVNLMRVLEAEQMSELDGMTRILQATARQRAEAFLRTVDKWRAKQLSEVEKQASAQHNKNTK